MSVDAESAAAPPPSNPPAVSMEVGVRPAPVEVSVPAYEAAGSGDLQIEVSDPHRAGEGMSKHVEYKVTYWSTLSGYTNVSGCVTRRYSDFEWLWKQLRATTDGIIVPSLPQKTLVANDDPTSAAIEARRRHLAVFVARIAAHPIMRESKDLQIFLEEQDKASWSERVPWYERGITSDAVRGVSDWFNHTVRLDDSGTAANLVSAAAQGISGVAAAAGGAASAAAAAAASPAKSPPAAAAATTEQPAATASQSGPKSGDVLLGSGAPASQGAPGDGITEDQHFLDVAEYIGKLKGRLDKLSSATSALVKHAQLTGSVLMEFARVVVDLDETEAKAKAVFDTPTNGVEWTNAAKLFASASGPPGAQAAAVTAAFSEPLDGAVALTQACVSACDARKAIVDHYNRLCKQIERLDQKAAAMGVPEPGPRREEKQKLELAASDTRIARTQAMGRYDKCRQHMEHELVWFHEELVRTMGAALKDLVVAQGASAGQAAHACAGHFEELRAMLRSAPAAFV